MSINTHSIFEKSVLCFQESFLDENFLKLVEMSNKFPHKVVHHVHRTKADHVYQFPIFAPHFCEKLVEELSNFETSDMPKGRPNTMNNYGVSNKFSSFQYNFLCRNGLIFLFLMEFCMHQL